MDDRKKCNLTPWSEWTPCTKSCGPEPRTRERNFVIKENRMACRFKYPEVAIQETEDCGNPSCIGYVIPEPTESITQPVDEDGVRYERMLSNEMESFTDNIMNASTDIIMNESSEIITKDTESVKDSSLRETLLAYHLSLLRERRKELNARERRKVRTSIKEIEFIIIISMNI